MSNEVLGPDLYSDRLQRSMILFFVFEAMFLNEMKEFDINRACDIPRMRSARANCWVCEPNLTFARHGMFLG